MKLNIKEAEKSAPILCQSILQVVFHPDLPELSPNILTDGEEWPALLAIPKTNHAGQVLTNTAAPNTNTTADVRRGKINSKQNDQRKFKPRHPDKPTTQKLTSRWRPVLEGVTAIQNMLSLPETLP